MLRFRRQPELHCAATSPRTAGAWLAMALLMLVALFVTMAFTHEPLRNFAYSHAVFALADDLPPEPSSGDGGEAEPDAHVFRIRPFPDAAALSVRHVGTSEAERPLRNFSAYRGQAPPRA